ncbi:MAG: hypothetical protein QXP36_14455 [Conexivisphaerales archaeon]
MTKTKIKISLVDLLKQKDELIKEYYNKNSNKNNKRGEKNE